MMTAISRYFPAGTYINTVWRLVAGPRGFFNDCNEHAPRTGQAVVFLAWTGALFAIATPLVYRIFNPLVISGILFANAIGMCLVAAIVGYSVLVMCFSRKTTFSKLFTVYAFSSGVVLILSWIPFSILFTEPWKWWLIYVGLTGACGLGKKEAVVVVVLSVMIIILFFRSLLAMFA